MPIARRSHRFVSPSAIISVEPVHTYNDRVRVAAGGCDLAPKETQKNEKVRLAVDTDRDLGAEAGAD